MENEERKKKAFSLFETIVKPTVIESKLYISFITIRRN